MPQMDDIQLSLFGKMFPEHSVQTEEKISEPSSKASSKSQSRRPLCLTFRRVDGVTTTIMSEMDGALLTELWKQAGGEFPSVAVESTLSSILEERAQEKYYLSAKACEGILRRADRRGKELPKVLRDALTAQTCLKG